MRIADGRQLCAVVKVSGHRPSNDWPREPACHVERQLFPRSLDLHDSFQQDTLVQEPRFLPPVVNEILLFYAKMWACFRRGFLLELQRA
jgi:hypothetical protein